MEFKGKAVHKTAKNIDLPKKLWYSKVVMRYTKRY